MELDFAGEIVEWRGPAPFLFVRVPTELSAQIHEIARSVTYGWGVIPVRARLGASEYTTSLFPKDGAYLVPIKVAVQRAENVGLGDHVQLRLLIGPG